MSAAVVQSCPTSCVTDGLTDSPSTSIPTRLWRLFRVALHVAWATLVLCFLLIPKRSRLRDAFLRHWYRGLLRIIKVRLVVYGERSTFAPPGQAVLVVANHMSWLDVVAFNAIQPLRMVSKAELASWPLIGWLAKRLRTVFIDRHSYEDIAVVRQVVGEGLRAGEVMGTFPESTTTCGRGIGHFHPAMFQAALDVGAAIRPVSFCYLDVEGRLTTAASFVGDMSLLRSIRTVLRERELTLRVRILPLLTRDSVSGLANRQAMARGARGAVEVDLYDELMSTADQPRDAACEAKLPDPPEQLSTADPDLFSSAVEEPGEQTTSR